MISRFEDETAEVSVVVHEQVSAGLHADIVGVSLADDHVPGGPVALVQRLLDVLAGELGHVGEGGVGLDAVDDRVRQLGQHLSAQVVALGDGLRQHLLRELLLRAQTVQHLLLYCSHGSYIIINLNGCGDSREGRESLDLHSHEIEQPQEGVQRLLPPQLLADLHLVDGLIVLEQSDHTGALQAGEGESEGVIDGCVLVDELALLVDDDQAGAVAIVDVVAAADGLLAAVGHVGDPQVQLPLGDQPHPCEPGVCAEEAHRLAVVQHYRAGREVLERARREEQVLERREVALLPHRQARPVLLQARPRPRTQGARGRLLRHQQRACSRPGGDAEGLLGRVLGCGRGLRRGRLLELLLVLLAHDGDDLLVVLHLLPQRPHQLLRRLRPRPLLQLLPLRRRQPHLQLLALADQLDDLALVVRRARRAGARPLRDLGVEDFELLDLAVLLGVLPTQLLVLVLQMPALLLQLRQLRLQDQDLVLETVELLVALLQRPPQALCRAPQLLLVALQRGEFEEPLVLQLDQLVVLEPALAVLGAEPAVEVLALADGVLQLRVLLRKGLQLVQQVVHAALFAHQKDIFIREQRHYSRKIASPPIIAVDWWAFQQSTIFLLRMNHSPEGRFSFKNLEPINYLKTFNRMVDYHFRAAPAASTASTAPAAARSSLSSPQRQLRVVSLSKFPTPASYEHMEGIFENVSKKKVEQDLNRYSKELEEEERFMKKHNDFMRRVLEKFIQHNQDRQKTYEKMKGFYGKDFKGRHLRANSESRLDKLKEARESREKEKEKEKERTAAAPSRTDNKATIGSEVGTEEQHEQRSVEVLPKLQPRQKKQKVVLKREKEIENYLVNRKLTHSHPATSPSANPEALHPSRAHLPSEEEEPLDFKQEIVGLQRRQARLQSDFSSRIEREIADFGRKMSTQVHAINYFNFWQEAKADPGEEERQRKALRGREQAQEKQERVDFEVNFRNYQST